ncbi:MAG: TonB-dependent receptor [Burkholderiales bacterium]
MIFARKPIALALALALPAAASPVGNAMAADDQATMLPEVTVNASKVAANPPAGASLVDEASVARLRSATSDSASLLGNVPGVSLYGAGGVSSLPVIHGLADDRLRIQVDGMDLISACPNHMNSPLSYVDPTNVASVKVYAGITPVSVGGDSLGGTIQANSPAPEFAAAGQGTLHKGQAGAFYRSNGNAMGGNLAATIASEKLSVTYSGSTAESDNYKAGGDFKTTAGTGRVGHTLPLDEVGSTAYKSINQTLGIALRNDNHLFDLKLMNQHIPYENYPNQRMDMTQNNSDQVNLGYTGQYQWGVLKARAYHEKTSHKMDFADDKQYIYGAAPGVVAPGMPMDTEGKNTGASVKADILLSERDILRVGAEAQHYRLNDWWPPSPTKGALPLGVTYGGMSPDTFWNIHNGQRDRYALFGEWEARINSQWTSLLGLRHETVKMDTGPVQGYNRMMDGYKISADAFNALNHQRTDNNLDMTALARYIPGATRSFEIGYAQKTRSPNLYERYGWSQNGMALEMNNFVGDGNGYLGNLDLKPEVAHTLSATADWHDAAREQWGLKITPYYTYVQNYIDAIRCMGSGMMMNALCGGPANNTATGKFVHLQYANQSAHLYGMDVSGHFPLAKSRDYGNFTATGLLNYARGENRTTGDNLYNIMPLNAKLAVVQRIGNWTNTIEEQLVDAKTQVSQVRNELKTGGYGLLNLRSSYEWKQVRFDVGVENALNKFYASPLGGAYVGQGMTMSLNGVSWGIPVPGMGRSIYTGLSVKF